MCFNYTAKNAVAQQTASFAKYLNQKQRSADTSYEFNKTIVLAKHKVKKFCLNRFKEGFCMVSTT